MGDQSHYLWDYWKEAVRRSWQDARHFESHVWWELALLGAVLIVLPTFAGVVLHLKDGLETLAISSCAVFFWYLFVVTPARIRRDLISRTEESETLSKATVEQYIVTQPNLRIDFLYDDLKAVLILNNSGAVAEYDASLVFSREFVSLPHSNLFCERGRQERLPKGSSRLLLAELRMHGDPVWLFYCSDSSKQRVPYRLAPRVLNGGHIDIEVVCHPENVTGTIRKRIVFDGITCSEQQITPPEDPAPSTASEQSPPS